MLKLNASYSKKVPADTEYSSQSYHAQIEIELPDGLNQQQLQEKVHNVFEFVRASVESELQGGSRQPVQPNGQMPQQPATAQMQNSGTQQYYAPQQNCQQQSSGKQNRNGNGAASPKQVNYLLLLAKRSGWTVQQILQRCQVNAIEQISSQTCSQLIQEFKGAAA